MAETSTTETKTTETKTTDKERELTIYEKEEQAIVNKKLSNEELANRLNNDEKKNDNKSDKKSKGNKKKGKKFKIITGIVTVSIVAGGVAYGVINLKKHKDIEKENKRIEELSKSGLIDSRQTSIDKVVVSGSYADELFDGNYKDLYDSYHMLHEMSKIISEIRALDIEHDIVQKNTSDNLCLDFTSADFQKQYKELVSNYYLLNGSREAQTQGTKEYETFQNICNTLVNTSTKADDIIFSDESREIIKQTYLVSQVAMFMENHKDDNNKPFDAKGISDLKLERLTKEKSDGFVVTFVYEGSVYHTDYLPVDDISTLINPGKIDALELFTIVNKTLAGDRNVSKNDDVIYENEEIIVRAL